jgi:hypothetical protein
MRNLNSMFVAMSVANLLTFIGVGALAVGVALVAIGIPAQWLALGGVVLALAALATRYLLARTLRPALERVTDGSVTTIYMPLLNDGTDAWRPVEAMKIGDLGYMVTESAPPSEEWAFQPGHILRCEERQLSGEAKLVAVAKAT